MCSALAYSLYKIDFIYSAMWQKSQKFHCHWPTPGHSAQSFLIHPCSSSKLLKRLQCYVGLTVLILADKALKYLLRDIDFPAPLNGMATIVVAVVPAPKNSTSTTTLNNCSVQQCNGWRWNGCLASTALHWQPSPLLSHLSLWSRRQPLWNSIFSGCELFLYQML